MVARAWSRSAAEPRGNGTNNQEPRLRGDIMRGLNIGVNTYNALIQSATLCHPQLRAHIFPPLSLRAGSISLLRSGAIISLEPPLKSHCGAAAISLRPAWGEPSTPSGVLHCGLCPLFISHRKVASSLRRSRSSRRALARRIDEPRSGAVANRQARKRLLTDEIQIEPRLQEGWQQKRGICIYFFSMLSCRC